jgi:predicted phosphodiesterase
VHNTYSCSTIRLQVADQIATTCSFSCGLLHKRLAHAVCRAVDAAAAALIQQLQPDIVVCGHSHKASCWQAGGVAYINPGSAGGLLLLKI